MNWVRREPSSAAIPSRVRGSAHSRSNSASRAEKRSPSWRRYCCRRYRGPYSVPRSSIAPRITGNDYLPAFKLDVSAIGLNVWGVSVAMPAGLQPSGLTPPLWFCPVRPKEYDAANDWCVKSLKHSMGSVNDLSAYLKGTDWAPPL